MTKYWAAAYVMPIGNGVKIGSFFVSLQEEHPLIVTPIMWNQLRDFLRTHTGIAALELIALTPMTEVPSEAMEPQSPDAQTAAPPTDVPGGRQSRSIGEDNAELYARADAARLASEQFVTDHMSHLIEATHAATGVRSRFYQVEHMNVGPGWMMREHDGKLPRRVYADTELFDMVATEEPAP